MSDPYLTNATQMIAKIGTQPTIVNKIQGDTRFHFFGAGDDRAQPALLPFEPINHGRNLRHVGEGIDYGTVNSTDRAQYFHTIPAPSPEVTHFPFLHYVVSSNLYVLGCTNPFIRPGAINKFGVHGLEARPPAGTVGPGVADPFLGGKQWHSSELGILNSYQLAVRYTPLGFLREWQLPRPTYVVHHNSNFLSPEIAAFVVSGQAFLNATSRARIRSIGCIASPFQVTGYYPEHIAYEEFYPVIVQNNKVFIAPKSKAINTALNFKHPSISHGNRIDRLDFGGDYTYNYRTAVIGNYLEEYAQFHTVTTTRTWLDVTNFPTIVEGDIDLSNDGPPSLLGYGYISKLPYGVTAASGRCIDVSYQRPIVEILYRIDDNQVRNVFNALIGDGTTQNCVYTWDYTVESYFTALGWILTTNNCRPGYTAVQPETPGTYVGEQRQGTCQV
jgi:hypothetical protein